MRLLTHSRKAAFCGCPKKHWFLYVRKRRALEVAAALLFGTVAHRCLEAYWRARMKKLSREERWQACLLVLTRCELDPFQIARLYSMLLVYTAIWDLTECEVLAVEQEFSFPLVHPVTRQVSPDWVVAGKVDVVIRYPDGRIVVPEHKTTSDEARPGGSYRQHTEMHGQISHYILGVRKLGLDTREVLYDVLPKPKQRPLLATPLHKQRRSVKTGLLRKTQRERAETAEEYGDRVGKAMLKDPQRHLVRLECRRNPDEQRRYYLNLYQWSEQMLQSEQDGENQRWNDDHCWQYNQPCEFWAVCRGRTSIDDPTRYRDASRASEELSLENECYIVGDAP